MLVRVYNERVLPLRVNMFLNVLEQFSSVVRFGGGGLAFEQRN